MASAKGQMLNGIASPPIAPHRLADADQQLATPPFDLVAMEQLIVALQQIRLWESQLAQLAI